MRRRTQGEFVLRLFGVGVAVFGSAGILGALLVRFAYLPPESPRLQFPLPFFASTVCLAGVSFSLHRAAYFVRREKQRPFRRALVVALVSATLFVGVQSYGLRWLAQWQVPEEASTGAASFVFAIAALHALHVAVALMFLIFVTMRGHDDRYDHEWNWGVIVCAWFWHFLGWIWFVILGVFAITTHG
ncbi:MAG: heme-copper oxidase subunit III [Planctomycetaceae bacterium]